MRRLPACAMLCTSWRHQTCTLPPMQPQGCQTVTRPCQQQLRQLRHVDQSHGAPPAMQPVMRLGSNAWRHLACCQSSVAQPASPGIIEWCHTYRPPTSPYSCLADQLQNTRFNQAVGWCTSYKVGSVVLHPCHRGPPSNSCIAAKLQRLSKATICNHRPSSHVQLWDLMYGHVGCRGVCSNRTGR